MTRSVADLALSSRVLPTSGKVRLSDLAINEHSLSGQGQFLFEPPTGPVLVQLIDHPPNSRSTHPILMKSRVSG